jgi:hypothetical protein
LKHKVKEVPNFSPQFLEFSPNELDKQQRALEEMSKNAEISLSQVGLG